MFGLHKWSLISFSRMNKVVSAACTITRESCFSCWGQRFGSDCLHPSISGLRWQTTGTLCPISTCLSWAHWSPWCLVCCWASLPVSHYLLNSASSLEKKNQLLCLPLSCFTLSFCKFLLSGGCKQEKRSSDLFVRKSDLICFQLFGKSEVRGGSCCQNRCQSPNKCPHERISEWSPQASDDKEKSPSEFYKGTDNLAFTDIDVISKDVETLTKF